MMKEVTPKISNENIRTIMTVAVADYDEHICCAKEPMPKEKTVEAGGAHMYPQRHHQSCRQQRPRNIGCRGKGRGLIETLKVWAL